MIFLLLSICCSTIIMLMFKAFKSYQIDNFQAIVFNYLTCFLIGLMTVESNILSGNFWQTPWFPFSVLLGCTFIATFQFTALTTQKNGITVATIAGKTTMVIPVMVAFFMYGDVVTFAKIAGILLAIAAIFLTASKDKQVLAIERTDEASSFQSSTDNKQNETSPYSYLLLPLCVFLAGGFIETVINYVQVYYLQEESTNAFSMFIFTIAAIIGLTIIAFQILIQRKKLAVRNIVAGICIGVPNYGSIYFFIMALQNSGLESSVVFPINNIGVVLLTTFAAFWLFREKLTKMNILGVVCAVVAILLIAF